MDVAHKDYQNKIKNFIDDIELLKSEIKDLKTNISTKEKELAESRIEIQQLKLKLTLQPNNQKEEELKNKNNEFKKQIPISENRNKALKIKTYHKDPTKDEDSVYEHGDKDNSKMKTKVSCKKCGLQFSSKEALKKHESDMHKLKLIF